MYLVFKDVLARARQRRGKMEHETGPVSNKTGRILLVQVIDGSKDQLDYLYLYLLDLPRTPQ